MSVKRSSEFDGIDIFTTFSQIVTAKTHRYVVSWLLRVFKK